MNMLIPTRFGVGLGVGLLACLSLLSLPANAAVSWSFVWSDVPGLNYSGDYASNAEDGGGVSTPYTYFEENNQTDTVTASGWAATGNNGVIENHDSNLRHWSGLSLDRSNDAHTIDNNGSDEFIILQFDTEISLTSFSFGYTNDDWDATVMAYTGADSADPTGLTIPSAEAAGLTNNGWNAIGHYLNENPSNAERDISTQTQASGSEVYSSYWVIGAYLSSVSSSYYGGNASGGWDGFKLASITGIYKPGDPGGEVPVPSTLLLFGLGLLLLRNYSRRQDILYPSHTM